MQRCPGTSDFLVGFGILSLRGLLDQKISD